MDTQKCMKCRKTSSVHKTGLCVECRTFKCITCKETVRGVKAHQKQCSKCAEKEHATRKNYKETEASAFSHMRMRD